MGKFIAASSGVFPLGGGALGSVALTPARTRGRRGGEGSAGPQRQRWASIASPWPSTTRTSSSAASRRASQSEDSVKNVMASV